MFRLFECCALSFFERFVLSFSLKIERFVSDSAEIWICGLYKENIGHVSGGVHKGEINKEEAKDVKEEEVPRLERRQRKWEDRGIRIGTTNNR